MKVSEHFDIREFVPEAVWRAFGRNCIWFVDPWCWQMAEFYREFFACHFPSDKGQTKCYVKVNTWHYKKNGHQYRGFRPSNYTGGARLSQHYRGCAFDCDIILVQNGKRFELDYKTAQSLILDHQQTMMATGLTTLEDFTVAKTWLHSDKRITGLSEILIVKP